MSTSVSAIIEKTPLFTAMDKAMIDRVASECKPRRFRPGEVLFRQDEVGDFAYVIVDGEVDVQVATPFETVRVAVIGAGQMVGELGALTSLRRIATVTARQEVQALRLEQASLTAALAEDPELALRVIGELGRRLQDISTPIAYLTYAVQSLRREEFDPEVLSALVEQASQFSHFAEAFKDMALELQVKQSQRAEMEMARSIQRSLLPSPLDAQSRRDSLRVHGSTRPARSVGGDFFDYLELGSGKLGIAMADVSGKGMPAALFMVMTRTLLRAQISAGLSPGACLAQVNRLLHLDNDSCMFVTLFLGLLDVASGEFVYANGGHCSPYLVTRDGGARLLEPTGGVALGLVPDLDYAEKRLELGAEDSLLLYTDGVTEALDGSGQDYGEARLSELLSRNRELDPRALLESVLEDVGRFAAGQDQADDITCLALRRGRATDTGTPKPDEPGTPRNTRRSGRLPDRTARSGRSMTITVLNRPQEIQNLFRDLEDFAASQDLQRQLVLDLELILDEHVSNIIAYGYDDDRDHDIVVRLSLDAGVVTVVVEDDGRPFDPLSEPEPDIQAPLEARRVGGVGIHLIKNFADQIAYAHDAERNRLTITKGLS